MGISLNQLRDFIQVAEVGSFSAAARTCGKAQSAVSTSVSNLEIELGVALFDRQGKYPVLTPEACTLLREAKQIIISCKEFTDRALTFGEGVDAVLSLAVDEIVPHDSLMDLLDKFGEQFPDTEIELLYGVLGDIGTMVAEGRADIGIMVPVNWPDHFISSRLVSHISFIPVASPEHPLAEISHPKPRDFESHRQLVITNRGGERDHESLIMGKRVWMLESTPAMVSLALRGAGWAFLPVEAVAGHLAAGRLVKLSPQEDMVYPQAPVYLIWNQKGCLGKAGQWMMGALSELI